MSYFTSSENREAQEAIFQILVVKLLLMVVYFLRKRGVSPSDMTKYMDELIHDSNEFISGKVKHYTK